MESVPSYGNYQHLGITLDAKLRFIEHIMTCADKAMKKLKIIESFVEQVEELFLKLLEPHTPH